MQLSPAGFDLIKRSEGFRAQTYLDVAGLPTIGYGHRLVHPEVYPSGITPAQAQVILQWDVRDAEQSVARLVQVPLAQGQFDALVDFVFNLGAARLAASTLLRHLNASRYAEAATELLRWDHAAGRELDALRARRQAELDLWNAAAAPAQQSAA